MLFFVLNGTILTQCIIPENYGSVLRDCSKAISINTKCSKAYYRSVLALLALDRVDEAIDCCRRCLAFDPSNTGIKSVHERTLKAKKEQEAREREREGRIKKEQEEKAILAAAYQVYTMKSSNSTGQLITSIC